MALYQLLFWVGALFVCLGLGVGAIYLIQVRRDEADALARQWKKQPDPHQAGMH